MTNCLECNDSELEVFRLVDLAHPAFAYRMEDAEASEDKLSGLKSGVAEVNQAIEVSQRRVDRLGALQLRLYQLLKVHPEFVIFAASRMDEGRTVFCALF